MKRMTSVLLILAMLCAFLPTGISAQEPETDRPVIDEAAIQQGLDYAQEHGYQELPAPEDEPSDTPAHAVRAPLEDNLVTPAPLMEGLAAKKGDSLFLPLIRYQTGKTGQMYAVLIFKGKETTNDPVETLIGSFTDKVGMFEAEGFWDTTNASYGTYTVVTCTVVSVNGSYNIVENSAFSEYVYVLDHDAFITGYYYADENGKRLDKLCYDGSGVQYFYVKHEPAIVTKCPDLIDSNSSTASISECNGLLVFIPQTFGWGTFSVHPQNSNLGDFGIDVEVCLSKNGHHPTQTLLCNPSENLEGGTLYYCQDCYASKIVRSDSNASAFNYLHDLPRDAWYFESVKEAVSRGLFKGVSQNRFCPNDTMTRAMLVTVLWRYAGSPKDGSNTFSDVKAGQWYTDAVAWAAKNHIVDGVGGGKFDPDGKITREQMAAILYRFAGSNGIDTSARAELGSFADSAKVSAWAKDALQWCVAESFIGGTKVNGTLLLDPQGSATRAQVSAILVRFIQKTDPIEQYVPLDPTGAEDSGSYGSADTYGGIVDWAFFSDGTLVFSGDKSRIPAGGTPSDAKPQEHYDMPWDKYADSVKTVRILNGIIGIGVAAFRGYPNLETAEMPDSVTYIDEEAFKNCTSLKNIRWPQKMLRIENNAFSGCSALEEVVIPDGLYYLHDAFSNCTGLKKVVLPDTLFEQSIYSGMNMVSSMGFTFDGCTSLTDVKLPIGMKTLPSDFFRNCTSLETVTFPLGLSHISGSAFDGCASLKTLVLPMQIYSMSDEAFCAESNFREEGYVDTCGLTDLYILNPLFHPVSVYNTQPDGSPTYVAPFGNKERVTVHAYAGTEAAELAQEMGYRFEALPTK